MLTSLTLSLQFVSGTAPEGKGCIVGWDKVSGGTAQIAKILPDLSAVGHSQTITMNFSTPIALDYDLVYDLFLQNEDNSFDSHAVICGYLIQK